MDLQKRLAAVTKYVARFRDPETLLKDLRKCDHKGQVTGFATLEQCKAQYSAKGHVYDDDILEAVQKGLKERQTHDPIKQARKRALHPLVKPLTPVAPKEEEHKKTPLLLKKHTQEEVKKEPPRKIVLHKIMRTT
jgi:hypothetical protein